MGSLRLHSFKVSALVAALALSACGGNYSNEDLAYLNALPSRAELQAAVPSNGTTTGALQTRRDALSVGERSKTYTDTKNISVVFNGALELFLGIIEEIRKHPPTSRSDNRRVWGPFPTEKHPGWNVQVVMVRADETHFDWFIEFRKADRRQSDPWLIGMSGKFLATSGVRKGQGEMHLFLERLRAESLTDANDDGKLATIDVSYVTDSLPSSVEMTLAGTNGGSVDYSYRAFETDRATMWFTIDQADGAKLHIRSGWNQDGAGRSTIAWEKGTADLDGLECWDSNFNVTYFSHPWSPLNSKGGDLASCVVVEGIQ